MHDDDEVETRTLADFEPGDIVAVSFEHVHQPARAQSYHSELVSIAWFEWVDKRNSKRARKVHVFVELFDRERWVRRQGRLDPKLVFPAHTPVLALVETNASYRGAAAMHVSNDETDPLLRSLTDDDSTLAF